MHIWPDSGTLAEAGSVQAGSGPNMGNAGLGGGGMAGGGGSPFPGMKMQQAPNAGEIILSRQESAALAALETEDDDAHGWRRASAESGMDDATLRRLKRRADTAISKGYTLKGPNFIKRPQGGNPDEPTLARKAFTDRKEQNAGEHPMRRKEDKAEQKRAKLVRTHAAKKVKEGTSPSPLQEANTLFIQSDMPRQPVGARVPTTPVVRRDEPVTRGTLSDDSWYLAEIDGYGVPRPQSDERPEAAESAKEANSVTTLAMMLRRNRRRRKS